MPSSFHHSQQTFVKYFLCAKSCGYKGEWTHRLKRMRRGSKIRSCSSLSSQDISLNSLPDKETQKKQLHKNGTESIRRVMEFSKGNIQGKLQSRWHMVWTLKISNEFIRQREEGYSRQGNSTNKGVEASKYLLCLENSRQTKLFPEMRTECT